MMQGNSVETGISATPDDAFFKHLASTQTWHFGTFRGRVYLGWNYNTFKSHRDRAGTEGVIEITLETG